MKTYGRKKSFQKCTQISIDFKEMCRLCLCCSGDRQNIFNSRGDVPLPLKILTCVSVEVYEGDGLPTDVCKKCLKLLEIFYKFRKQCEEVNSKLHDISKKHKDAPESEVLQQKQEDRRKMTFVDLLYNASKDIKGEIVLDDTTCVMNTLLIDCENITGTNNDSLQEATLDHRINTIYNNNNNIKDNNSNVNAQEQSGIISDTRGDNVGHWQSAENNTTENTHFHVGENISSVENTSPNNIRNVSAEECVTSNHVEASKSQSLTSYTHLEPLSANSEGLIFRCDKCPKGFSKRIDLKRHSSVHDQQRGFVCAVCEKWFPNKTSYKRHERIHTGEKPFSCSYCQKCFSQDSILSRHLLIHTGEKPFKCELCGKGFTQREGLKVHMRQHDYSNHDKQQQPQYYCPLCKKGFCHQSGLSRHLITHTGKTFDCPMCSKPFSDQSSLKRHTKKHNSIKNEMDL
ncbi:hypothetical protein R5R35_005747 [Gryllus longicercus]|uniref:Zinc finger protein n=1 Tax=Gryllus longicercus TaxID=2509291 RepID=A0AAN9VYE4_9ORTH